METFNKETREKNIAVKAIYPFRSTGCSLNIVFCEIFKIYSGLWPLSVSVSVHNGRSNNSAGAADIPEIRKITTF